MTAIDTRDVLRDSLLQFADLHIDGQEESRRVKMRNLSAQGMMVECAIPLERGTLVGVHLRNIGWVKGSIAWVQDGRMGVAFAEQIDPLKTRIQDVSTPYEVPPYLRVRAPTHKSPNM